MLLTVSQLSLKGRALRYLAAREHSRAELERKLAAHAPDVGELAAVLDALTARGLLSDQRAAESLAHRRGAKLGTARVVQELKARGVEPQAIAEVASQLRTTELQRAREVWARRFGQAPAEPAERVRQSRFLAQRGFSADTIAHVLRKSPDSSDV